MSSFDVFAVTYEINKVLPASIENIYQIDPTTILLNMRQPSKAPSNLLIKSGRCIHLTTYSVKKPTTPSKFCMTLRKYLRNGLVNEIKQHEFERIISILIKTKHGIFKLIVECFAKGNIILVNSQNAIVLALTYRKMKDRNILAGKSFRQAPPSGLNPFRLSKQDLWQLREQGDIEVVNGLVNLLSIGGIYAEEILLTAHVDKKVSCRKLSDQQIGKIHGAVEKLLWKLEKGKFEPHILLDEEGKWMEVLPFPLAIYQGLRLKPYKTFNEAADDYFTRITAEKAVKKETSKVEEALARYKRILEHQQKQLKTLQASVKTNQAIGDLLYTRLNELQMLIQNILHEKRLGKDWKQISAEYAEMKNRGISPATLFESTSPMQRIITVKINETIIPLTFNLSVQENATRYYKKAKKARRKLEGLSDAMKETESKIRELKEKIIQVVEELPKPKKKREKAWYEKFRWFHSSEGLLVIGGKDAASNELIIKRYTEPKDLVFHADLPGAPIAVIKTGGKKPLELTLQEAAQFAASYSRAWREGLGSADVYWVNPDQVSKEAPSGQYLGKGMFMIRGQRSFVHNVPLQLAIGVKKVNEHWIAIGGPASAIKVQTYLYVEIGPGEQPSGRLAKQIKSRLARKSPEALSKEISAIPTEEIQNVIPAGKGALT